MQYIYSHIDYIAKIRNLRDWDNEFNRQVKIVGSYILKLRAFGDIPDGNPMVRAACHDTADRLQDLLAAAIEKHYTNN